MGAGWGTAKRTLHSDCLDPTQALTVTSCVGVPRLLIFASVSSFVKMGTYHTHMRVKWVIFCSEKYLAYNKYYAKTGRP